MISRVEVKFLFNQTKKINFLNWLQENNFKNLYPERKINSLYYDNNNLSMYHNSIEGIVPRKKIRARWYGEKSPSNIQLETKITDFSNRLKTSKKLTNFPNTLFDKNYGLCKPYVNVSYNRRYYNNKNLRITIDENINYSSINNFQNYKINKIFIVEIKCSQNTENQNFIDNFPFRNIRYSKYTNAIETIFDRYSINNIQY